MLKKLIKHEFRATSRIMWPIFLGMLALTLLMRLCGSWVNGMEQVPWMISLLMILVSIGFALGLFALALAPLVLSAIRFRNHILKSEGYLTMTLPASTHQLLSAKLIVSCVWYALTCCAGFLILSFALFNLQDFAALPRFFADLFEMIPKVEPEVFGHSVLILFEFLLNCISAVTLVSLMIYAAYAIGFSFQRHKSAWTVLFLFFFFNAVQYAAISALFGLSWVSENWHWESLLSGIRGVEIVFAVSLLAQLALCGIFYGITYRFITKRLNLE